ncbi:GNAT family N-acetyltransferase [Primorskyibacter aestuariivivens]|uniref:GNAT family N-acetyltransferase n=1 Tax=Primorskyibacter aestuariivivens TaxID=1888912 RepID=UPI002301BA4A|nr:GNAT family N-acetyltransferase [Primorskyibacter aestuariivivens]MDA7430423.1 GNAT family N-acetyltransferase [Primorskyibacter aestuariivivens]
MKAILKRSGYRIQPCMVGDRPDVAEYIFGDTEVAKTLVHNVSSREGALAATNAWIDTLAIDGKKNIGTAEHIGLWTIRDESRDNQFVGIRGVFVAPGLPANSVATFVAVARAYWGQGVSSDSSRILCEHVFETSDADAIYTRVWPNLNPASDAVQRRLGFVRAKRHTLRNTFGEARMKEVLEFDLWRASQLRGEDFDETLRQVSIRIGQLAAENLLDSEAAFQRIINTLPDALACTEDLQTKIMDDLKSGLENPAWATYRLSRDNWSASLRGTSSG